MKRAFILLFLLAFIVIGGAPVFAQTTQAGSGTQFQPIVPIPLPGQSGTLDSNTSLACYINGLYQLAIAVAVSLAILMIVIDGFKYMTSEAVGNKKDALAGIRSALFGLIILLASVLVLNIINPQIASLSVAGFGGGNSACSAGGNSAYTPAQSGLNAGSLGTPSAPTQPGTQPDGGGTWSFTDNKGTHYSGLPTQESCNQVLKSVANGGTCTQGQ